jgi:hypothetical protein
MPGCVHEGVARALLRADGVQLGHAWTLSKGAEPAELCPSGRLRESTADRQASSAARLPALRSSPSRPQPPSYPSTSGRAEGSGVYCVPTGGTLPRAPILRIRATLRRLMARTVTEAGGSRSLRTAAGRERLHGAAVSIGPRLDRALIYQNDRSVPGLILLTRKLRKKNPK